MDSHSYNSNNNLNSGDNDLDPEAQHLAFLQRQMVQPSPMQPTHHDNVGTPGSVFQLAQSPAPRQIALLGDDNISDRVRSNLNADPATPSSAMLAGGLFSVGQGGPMTPRTPYTPVLPDVNIIPQLQNIVSTVNLGCKLDLKKIALHARNAEYNPKRFAAVIMRIREPRTTALIFSSGKMVCTGAKSEDMSRLAARKYARIVQKLGFEVSFVILLIAHNNNNANLFRRNFLTLKFKTWLAAATLNFPFDLKV